jgi:hypothetical protein
VRPTGRSRYDRPVRLLLAAALLVAAPQLGAAAAAPVIEDDWPRALALAKAKDLPVFVDAWAPW